MIAFSILILGLAFCAYLAFTGDPDHDMLYRFFDEEDEEIGNL